MKVPSGVLVVPVVLVACLYGSHGQQGSWEGFTEVPEETCSNDTFFSSGTVHLLGCSAGGSQENSSVCGLCPDGWERNSSGDIECRRCPAGETSSPLRGSPECTSCVNGKFRPEGAPDCEECKNPGQIPNANRTACVCGPGYFNASLYPNIVWDWDENPATSDWTTDAACIECESVICPGDRYNPDTKRVEHANTCVHCPGGADGGNAYMWPRMNFWIPEPLDLVINPLVPHSKKSDGGSGIKAQFGPFGTFTLNAVEQCHPPELCGGYEDLNATHVKLGNNTNPHCAADPTKCCHGSSGQEHGSMCSSCKDNFMAHPTSGQCEVCESPGYGGIVTHMLLVTANSAFFDFKSRQVNVEEDGGGLAILIFFGLQLAEYTRGTFGPFVNTGVNVVKLALELEPGGGGGDAKSCVFGLSPHQHFFFRVLAVPFFQYLIVVAIGRYIDQWISNLRVKQSSDSPETTKDEQASIFKKVESFLMKHYDSSQLRYLRALDEQPAAAEPPRQAAMRMWWQAAAKALTKKQIGKQGWRGQLQVMVAVYIPVTRLCIRMLFGHPLATAHVGAAAGGDKYTWLSSYDPTVKYFSPTHIIAMIVALIVMAVLTVGFPVFLILKNKTFRDPKGQWKPGRFTITVRLSYVFKEDFRWWQAVVMFRQVWLVGAKEMAVLFASPKTQLLSWGGIDWRHGVFFPIMISVMLQSNYQPYQLWHDNVLEQTCQLGLLVVIWTSVMHDKQPDSDWDLNVIVLLVVIIFITGLWLHQTRGRKLAKLSHQADFFGLSQTVSSSGTPTSTTTDAVDDEDEDQISRTVSMATASKRKLSARKMQDDEISVTNNPILEEDDSAADESQAGEPASRTKAGLSLSNLIGTNRSAIEQDVIDKLKFELKLSDEAIQQNVKLFQTFDNDHSGFLSPAELVKVFELGRGIHVSMEKIETLMTEIDKNQDGRISFSEFVQVMVNHNRQREAKEELREAFKIFLDAGHEDGDDSSQEITTRMLKAVLKSTLALDEEEAETQAIAIVDACLGGEAAAEAQAISFKDFTTAMFEFNSPTRSRKPENMDDTKEPIPLASAS